MAFSFVNQAEQIMLEHMVNKTTLTAQNVILRLFKSNTTPAETDTEGTYTEADFTGYAAITLTGASWTYSHPTISYAEQTFTSSANGQSQTIYGYYLTWATSGKLLIAERFAGTAPVIQNNGDTIKATPTADMT